jgi:hypothetical protein
MSGYTRQSVADIVPTAVVRAAPINAEYNKLRDAFAQSDTGTTGHKHDGTSDEGSYVPLIADLDAKNKFIVSQADNRFGLFVEVSNAATEQLRFQDGLVVPVTDNDIDLGTSLLEYKNAYFDGTVYADTLSVGDNDYTTITDNTYTVSAGNLLVDVAGNINLDADGGDVALKDAGVTYATFTSNSGNLTLKSGTTTAVTFTGANADFAGTLDVTGAAKFDNNVTIDGNTIIGDANTDTVAINAKISTALIPTADSSFDLGSSSAYWKDSYIDSVTTTGNVNIGGNITVNGTADFTNTTLDNVTDPSSAQQAATKNYVDTAINNLIGGAPGTLDTLDEIAAAINDDNNVYTTLTNSIATKLSLSGGSMTGAIAMGGNKITGAGAPTTGSDLTNKTYVDGILGSATAAADSAADAQKLAINPEDSQFTLSDSSTTGFSALHYAEKAEETYTNLLALASVVSATVADYGFINTSPTSTSDYGAL